MRPLLDAHVSGRRFGRVLSERGHDVRAVNEEPELDGLTDELLLALAAEEGRVLITFNIRHFVPALQNWTSLGRSHAGCVLVARFDHRDFGPVLRSLEQLFGERSRQEEWVDYVRYLSPGP